MIGNNKYVSIDFNVLLVDIKSSAASFFLTGA